MIDVKRFTTAVLKSMLQKSTDNLVEQLLVEEIRAELRRRGEQA